MFVHVTPASADRPFVRLALSAPGKNALGLEVMRELLHAIEASQGQPLLVTGTGDAFSAGLNLKEVVQLNLASARTFLGALETVMARLFAHPAPTVAAINGHAIAGGCVLALCCDHRVAQASPTARIGLTEVALGLRYPPSIRRLVLGRVSVEHARDVVLGAGLFSPEQALSAGLVDRVSGSCEADATEWLCRVAQHPRAAYAAAKADFFGRIEATAEEARRFDTEELPAWASDDIGARVMAYLASRGSR